MLRSIRLSDVLFFVGYMDDVSSAGDCEFVLIHVAVSRYTLQRLCLPGQINTVQTVVFLQDK
jgi:hypothetical protein